MIRFESIKIEGVGPINNLDLKFNDHFNIICGQNGVGKTTILDCIAQSFGQMVSLKRNANNETGNWTANILRNESSIEKKFYINIFEPNNSNSIIDSFYNYANEVIVFKTHRDIQYSQLPSINTDAQKNIHQFSTETVYGSSSNDIKNYIINRHLWSNHDGALDHYQKENIALAKECFNLLDNNIYFEKITPRTNDIMIHTPHGSIYFEYLSSGFKSCLAILIGLIKEIELRYKEPYKYIKDFDGIVIIDELDLHLHPEYQAKIYEVLNKILPKAQFFISTHSPHIIQVANSNEIISIKLNEENKVERAFIHNPEFGFQGWTVEEILTDVMMMSDTRTLFYKKTIEEFNNAMNEERYEDAKACFEIIDKMIHPQNILRNILRIQLLGL